MMLRTTTHLGRRAFGLAALSAFALSACGAEKTAEFDPAGGSGASDKGGGDAPAPSEAAAPDLPQLEAGFVFEEFTKDITVAGTLQPQNSTIITRMPAPTSPGRLSGRNTQQKALVREAPSARAAAISRPSMPLMLAYIGRMAEGRM